MKLALSRGAIISILAACAIAAFALRASTGDDSQAGTVALPARKDRVAAVKPSGKVSSSDLSAKLDLLEARSKDLAAVPDLFGAPSPAQEQLAVIPATPSRPMAPAFPYTYIGAMQDASGRTVYLSSADRVILAKPHQTIDGVYQVDRIEPGVLTVTYLPLHQTQTIALERSR